MSFLCICLTDYRTFCGDKIIDEAQWRRTFIDNLKAVRGMRLLQKPSRVAVFSIFFVFVFCNFMLISCNMQKIFAYIKIFYYLCAKIDAN